MKRRPHVVDSFATFVVFAVTLLGAFAFQLGLVAAVVWVIVKVLQGTGAL